GITGGTPQAGYYDVVKAGLFGTLYLHSATGAYEYDADDAKINAAHTTLTDSFEITVTDLAGASDAKTLTVTINGVNDTPVISATLASTTFTDTSADDTFASVNGQLTGTDRHRR